MSATSHTETRTAAAAIRIRPSGKSTSATPAHHAPHFHIDRARRQGYDLYRAAPPAWVLVDTFETAKEAFRYIRALGGVLVSRGGPHCQ